MAETGLSKMDPMVRKLETSLEEFKMALSNNDLVAAQQFLRAINQTSDYLAEDVTSIYKGEIEGDHPIGVNDTYAGGVPIMQFNQTEQINESGEHPLGLVQPNRIGSIFQPHRSPNQQ
jgi:hypothetical protein